MYSRKLISLFFCQFLYSCNTDAWRCNDTLDDLKIYVEDEAITAIYTEEIAVSAYINYPPNFAVVAWDINNDNFYNVIANPDPGDNCRYNIEILGSDYENRGLNFNITFRASEDYSFTTTVTNITMLYFQVEAEISSTLNREGCRISGENATLLCNAIGNPIPSIAWSRSLDATVVTTLSQPDFANTVSATAELQLYKVTFEDKGNYRCSVNNTVGNPQSEVDDVQDINLEVNLPVILINRTQNMTVEYGNSATLSCMFQAFPLPNTTWSSPTSGGYEITELDSEQYYRTTTLEIQNVTCNYIGQYFCQASNMVCGNATKIPLENFAVNITEPSGVENLKAEIPECGNYVSLSWSKTDDWTDESSYYVTSNSTNPPQSLTNENITLENLTTNTVYEFKVTVVLCNVSSNVATITKETASIGIPGPPINVTQTPSEDDTICTVTWTKPRENYDGIDNYEVSYYSCQGDTDTECGEPSTVNTNETSYQIDMSSNLKYYFSVSAETCAGKSKSATANGTPCIRYEKDTNVVAIVVPIVVVVILVVAGIGIWCYIKKNNEKNENLNSVEYNAEDVSRNDYKYDMKETTNNNENSGRLTARVSPTHEE